MVVLNPRKYLCRGPKYESIFLLQGSCEENIMASSRSLDLSLAGDLEGLEMVRTTNSKGNLIITLFQLDEEIAVASPDLERKSSSTAFKTELYEKHADNVVPIRRNKSYVGTIAKEPSWAQKKEEVVSQDSISEQSSAQSSKRNSLEPEAEDSEGLKRLWRRMTRRSRDSGIGSERGSWTREIHSNPVRKMTKRIRSASRSKSSYAATKELLKYEEDDLQKAVDKEAKKRFRLEELLDFEAHYLTDLDKIVWVLDEMKKSRNDPNHPVPMPLQLREGRDLIVANNFHELHRLHRDVIGPGIRENLHQPEKLKQLFEREAPRMRTLYAKYFTKHLNIAHIIKAFQIYFKKITKITKLELSLASQVNLPSMHLTRYPLFFQVLAKSSEEDEAQIYWDIFTITRKMSQGINDMMAVKRMTTLPPDVDPLNQGELIHRGPLATRKKTGFKPHTFKIQSTIFV